MEAIVIGLGAVAVVSFIAWAGMRGGKGGERKDGSGDGGYTADSGGGDSCSDGGGGGGDGGGC